MKVLFKNSKVVVSKKRETYEKFGFSDATIEAFASSYNADATFRGIDYGSRKTAGIRWYAKSAGTINIGVGVIGAVVTTVATVEAQVGWNTYYFDEPVPAGTYILLNGKGTAYVLGTSKPSETFTYYGLDSNGWNAQLQARVIQRQNGTGGTIPGVQLFMLVEE